MSHRSMKTPRSSALTVAAMAAEYLERMGARIRTRREELGLSRDEVARRMAGKTNGNAIYRWERGEHRPQDDTLEELAAVLGVDPGYFLAPAPQPGAGDLMGALAPAADQAQLDRIERKLDDLISLLPEEALLAILEREGDRTDEQPKRPVAKSSRTGRSRKAS